MHRHSTITDHPPCAVLIATDQGHHGDCLDAVIRGMHGWFGL